MMAFQQITHRGERAPKRNDARNSSRQPATNCTCYVSRHAILKLPRLRPGKRVDRLLMHTKKGDVTYTRLGECAFARMSARQRQPGTLMHVNMSTPRLLAHWGMGPCRGQSGGGEPIGEGPSAELLFLRLLCVGVGEASPEVVLPEPRPFFAAFGVRGLRGLVP